MVYKMKISHPGALAEILVKYTAKSMEDKEMGETGEGSKEEGFNPP
jgi:hypothetical protein